MGNIRSVLSQEHKLGKGSFHVVGVGSCKAVVVQLPNVVCKMRGGVVVQCKSHGRYVLSHHHPKSVTQAAAAAVGR